MYLIIDFEATCWADDSNREHSAKKDNEIIEIGSALVDDQFQLVDRHSIYVRPVRNPILSDFCKQLTSIKQEDVDNAKLFPEALKDFLLHIESKLDGGKKMEDLLFCSWGHYDKNQLKKDCDYNKVPYPFKLHISLKHEFANRHKFKAMGTVSALNYLGLQFEGVNHRGLDDAYNIARIFIREWKPTGLQVSKQHIIRWSDYAK